MNEQETYIRRCVELAKLGAGSVAPNPMVGAVLVHNERIIGEGYHRQYGQAHAEANCIDSVCKEDEHLLPFSTMYVSLEPCAHYGKTPPCADLIIRKNIPHVVVGCRDPFELVDGKGIEKLRAAGVQVTLNVLEAECKQLNNRFFTFHTKQRPFIVLKWAQTADGKITSDGQERLLISNEFTNRLVHRWRSEEAAIMVGTNTAKLDDPRLDNRLWSGKSPVRMVLDRQLQLPLSLHLFDNNSRTIVLNSIISKAEDNTEYYKVSDNDNIIPEICKVCYKSGVQSLLVEGGAQLLQTFINEGLWDEARVITNQQLFIGNGLAAPSLSHHQRVASENIFRDSIHYFTNLIA